MEQRVDKEGKAQFATKTASEMWSLDT